jgi:Family of unknown function (DUF5946)
VPRIDPSTLETCPGCGLVGWPPEDEAFGSAARFGASSACWATFSEVLQREYESRMLFLDIHSLTLDAYAAQHPQALPDASLATHLVRLHLVFELGYETGRASARARRFARRERDYGRLHPVPAHAELTVAHVLPATSHLEHMRRVWEWSECVWQSWAPHHAEIARWARRSG